MVTVDEFCNKHSIYSNYIRNLAMPVRGVSIAYFIDWDPETAPCWGGPWPGNLVFAFINDCKITHHKYLKHKTNETVGDPTIEEPFRLMLLGNDDTSYSKFFASEAEAREMLELFTDTSPTWDDLYDFGFVFTN